MKTILSAFAILILSAAAADAQTCAGGTDISGGAHRLVVGGTMADAMSGANAAYGFGRDRFFGHAGLGFNRIDGLDANQTAVSTLFGSQFRSGSRLALCPIGQADWGFGPNNDPVSVHSVTVAGGGRVGIETGSPERFNVVPTAGVSFVRQGVYASNSFLGTDANLWDTYGMANVGVGLRFNRSRMAVVPSVSIPMGLDGADPSFVVSFNSNF